MGAFGRVRTVVALLVACGFLDGATQGSPGSATAVAGRVIDAATGRGISGAVVQARSHSGRERHRGSFSRDNGEFRVSDLVAGSYEITAIAPGYLAGSYGRRRPGGQAVPVTLAGGELAAGLDILLWTPAIISGRVLNERGDPVAGVNVRALPRRAFNGVPPEGSNAGSGGWTNDLGEYEIPLVPDDYVLLVPVHHVVWPVGAKGTRGGSVPGPGAFSVPDGSSQDGRFNLRLDGGLERPVSSTRDRPLTYVTTFHPSATHLDEAQLLRAPAGSVHRFVDIRLAVRPHRRVTGRAVDHQGQPLAQVILQFHPDQRTLPPDPLSFSAAIQVMTHDDGSFDLMRIPPGGYTVEAFRRLGDGHVILPDELGLWARTRLEVGGQDITDLEVVLRPGVEVKGTIVVDASGRHPAPSVHLASAEHAASAGIAQKAEPGQFRLTGVRPGRYALRVNTSSNSLMVSSIMLVGQDVLDKPIDVGDAGLSGLQVTLTDRLTNVHGTVAGPDGRPLAGAMVAMFPVSSSDREAYGQHPLRLRRLQADRHGAWSTRGVPPGDYFLTVLDVARLDEWPDAKLLDELARAAVQVSVTGGSSHALRLRQGYR